MIQGETKEARAKSVIVKAELKGKDKRFETVVLPFMDEAERTIKHLEEHFKETCEIFLGMCIWFGWPEAKVDFPLYFFSPHFLILYRQNQLQTIRFSARCINLWKLLHPCGKSRKLYKNARSMPFFFFPCSMLFLPFF
jgi:hypothetical protein